MRSEEITVCYRDGHCETSMAVVVDAPRCDCDECDYQRRTWAETKEQREARYFAEVARSHMNAIPHRPDGMLVEIPANPVGAKCAGKIALAILWTVVVLSGVALIAWGAK